MLLRRRDDQGAAAVEFALVMLPLLYLVFGIIQFGFYFWASNSGQSATAEAVRRLTVGDCTTTTELETFLKNKMGSATTTAAADLNPTVVFKKADGSNGQAVGGSVTLTVTYKAIDMNLPFIPMPENSAGDVVVTREVFARVEDTVPMAGGCA